MFRSTILRAFYLGIVFLANLVLANILMPSYFGNISLLIVNGAIVSLVTGLGAENILLYYLSNKKWNISFAFSFLWLMTALQIFLFALFQVMFYFFYHKTLLTQNDLGFGIIEFIYFVGLIIAEKYVALFYSTHKDIVVNKSLLIIGCVYLLILLIIQYLLTFDLTTAISYVAVYNFLQGIVLIIVFHSNQKNLAFEKISKDELFKILKLSGIIMITNVIQTLAYRIDFLFVKYYHSDYEVGIYAQANKFANLLWIIPNIISMLLIPKFGRIEKEKVSAIFRGGFFLNIAVCCITIIVSNLVYFSFLSPEYRSGLAALYLMLPGYVCWATVLYFSAYISWQGHFYYNLLASFCCFIIIFFCDFLLIPKLSIEGAAISNTIAYSLTFILYLIIFKRLAPCKIYSLFIPKRGDFYFLKNIFK